jgi:hypothetical protein
MTSNSYCFFFFFFFFFFFCLFFLFLSLLSFSNQNECNRFYEFDCHVINLMSSSLNERSSYFEDYSTLWNFSRTIVTASFAKANTYISTNRVYSDTTFIVRQCHFYDASVNSMTYVRILQLNSIEINHRMSWPIPVCRTKAHLCPIFLVVCVCVCVCVC